MKAVFLLGMPGVGKTALFEELVKHKRQALWLTPQEAKLVVVRRIAWSNLRKYAVPLVLSYLPLLRSRVAKQFPFPDKKLLVSWHKRAPDFLESCIACMCGSAKYPLRLLSVSRLPLQFLRDTEVLGQESSSVPVLFDGDRGFLQRWVAGVLAWCLPEQADTFFRTLPAPAGIVYLALPAEEHEIRLRTRLRAGDIDNWWGMSEDEVMQCARSCREVYESGLAVLRSRGVQVLVVDATRPASENAKTVETFLSSLSKSAK